MASEPATGAVYVVSHDNPGILRLVRPGERIGTRRAAAVTGASRVSAELPELPWSRSPRSGQHAGARLRDGGPGEQHRRGRATLRRGRDPDGDRRRQRTDAGDAASGRCRRRCAGGAVDGRAGRARRGSRRAGARRCPTGLRRAAGTDRRVGLRVDAARRARGARTWRAAAVPGRRSAIRAPGDQRVQHGRQPDRAAVHVDREVRPECAGHQVARRLRRRPGAGRARCHRYRNARHAQWRDRHRVRSALRRGPRQRDSRVGHRQRRADLVVAVRRRLHRLAGDVRNGGASVSAGARGGHAAPGAGAAPTGPLGWIAYALPLK